MTLRIEGQDKIMPILLTDKTQTFNISEKAKWVHVNARMKHHM